MNKTPRKVAAPAAKAKKPPRPRVSDRIGDSLLHAPDDLGSKRHDGWTKDRIRIFLHALAACGVVEDAARAAGMSSRSAYKLRNSAKGRGFHLAWNATLRLGRHRLGDLVMSRAVNGCVEVITRDGEVWGERHRYDNRLTMDVLARLDRQVTLDDDENKIAGAVAEGFEEYVDLVAAGDEKGAADFVDSRRPDTGHGPHQIVVRFIDPKGEELPSDPQDWDPEKK